MRAFCDRLTPREIDLQKSACRNANVMAKVFICQVENSQAAHANFSDQTPDLIWRDRTALVMPKQLRPGSGFAGGGIPDSGFTDAMITTGSYRGIGNIEKTASRRTLMPEFAR